VGDDATSATATILVIDDEPMIHDTYNKQLANDPYRLLHAYSGDRGFAMLAPEIDLVICDVVMPGTKDGFAVCRAMRASPDWRTVPIMLVTSLADESDLVQGLEAGADEFLTKPVAAPVLRSRIIAMLRIRRQYAELAHRPTLAELIERRLDEACADSRISPRERDVVRLLLHGKSLEEIATALQIAERTVKFHQANVLGKLGIDSRAELLRVLL
jgi:DNA-binding NarL/FixJ family response regulator